MIRELDPRMNKADPASSSNRGMAFVKAGCVRSSRFAAAVKLPASTTARK